MKTITNKFKLAIVAVGLLAISTTNAQQTTGTFNAIEKVGKSSELNGTIRVIDNKGTKKYLQVKNGLTLFTDQTPDGGIVSTWQLGGTLTDDTFIDASGAVFGITGIKEIDATTNPTTDIAATAYDGTGYTIMVRDEATGETKKILASELLQVQSGHDVFTAAVAGAAPTAGELTFDLTVALPDFKNVWVYRNGAKLVAGVDYTITGTTIVLVPNTTQPNDWTLYSDDIIEVQFVK
ncbi:hypothetical protein [Tenacibaculum aestuariivivum]|uniref:hypothetical protein n=1 Tax=Tenacibaculum aestuariivivum TaxID=2006131 RepID=UPI003AB53A69